MRQKISAGLVAELFHASGMHDEDFIECLGRELFDAVLDAPVGPHAGKWDGVVRIGNCGLQVTDLGCFLDYHVKVINADTREMLEAAWARHALKSL